VKTNKIFLNKYFRYSTVAIGGIFLGWLFFHSPRKSKDTKLIVTENNQATIWTCAMHPHIHMSEPGKCPICGMDLITLNQNNFDTDPAAIHLTKEAAELANVMTSFVTKEKPMKEVRLFGKVQADERLIQSQAAHFPGRIEKLLVNFTGESVKSGQALAVLYSPELIIAQQELLEAAKVKQFQPEIFEASKEKLRQWKLSEDQIASVESSGIITNSFEVVSNTSGIVTARYVNNGDHIGAGTILFEVSDLSRVWILFDAYESDLQFLKPGDVVDFTVQALPGVHFSCKIKFIDPVINPVTRVAKVRLETNNSSGRLKPEMFVTGVVKARLDEYRNSLVIPRSAVLWTGLRSIVYVKQPNIDEPVFKIREIGLGPMLGNSYVITDGLNEGEEIVTQGAFSVDAAAQLEGKPSMMNPHGGTTSSTPGMIIVNMDFTMQLNTVFEQYIVLKDAFVQSDVKKVKQAAEKMEKSLSSLDMKLLTDDAHTQGMDITDKLDNQLKQIASSGDIESQRKAFSSFSNEFYKAIKIFGLMGKTVYYQFCPMAFDEKGAFWLSTTKEIRNPYYGDQMLTCGEIKETLQY
jgi:Cu(I)/Ag(I) efflux system membrane fusion protein